MHTHTGGSETSQQYLLPATVSMHLCTHTGGSETSQQYLLPATVSMHLCTHTGGSETSQQYLLPATVSMHLCTHTLVEVKQVNSTFCQPLQAPVPGLLALCTHSQGRAGRLGSVQILDCRQATCMSSLQSCNTFSSLQHDQQQGILWLRQIYVSECVTVFEGICLLMAHQMCMYICVHTFLCN